MFTLDDMKLLFTTHCHCISLHIILQLHGGSRISQGGGVPTPKRDRLRIYCLAKYSRELYENEENWVGEKRPEICLCRSVITTQIFEHIKMVSHLTNFPIESRHGCSTVTLTSLILLL